MCKYCEGDETLYQESNYADVYIGNFGKRKVLKVESKPQCPKFVDCSAKGMIKSAVFFIDYCPACGRKLSTD